MNRSLEIDEIRQWDFRMDVRIEGRYISASTRSLTQGGGVLRAGEGLF
jgi:primosomal replication protein N